MSDADGNGPAPLFLLSFRQRDELASLLSGHGWRLIAARRREGAAHRFAACGACVAVIDARGAIEDGLAAIGEIAAVAEGRGAAVVALLSKSDPDKIGAAYDAGATHFLLSPMTGPEIAQGVRFAQRYAERLCQGSTRGGQDLSALGWRYDPALKSLQITTALAARLSDVSGPFDLLRMLSPEFRRLAIAALRRARRDGSTAFVHALDNMPRVVSHIQYDAEAERWHALIEPLGSMPDPRVELRDMLSASRDAPAARRWIDHRLNGEARVALILIGLGQFAAVNTAYGRAAGDQLLSAASKRLGRVSREILGRNMMVARTGGAEFAVATADPDPERVRLAAERAAEALGAPYLIAERPATMHVRTSTVWSAPGDTAEALLRRASEGLVETGGSLAADSEGEAPGGDMLEKLAREVTGAIDAEQIDILFQPQVSVSSGEIMGAEALARWRHPTLGELGAETLFAAAERARITAQLSEHVQRHALKMAARWPAVLNGLRLSLNITAEDVARPGFADILLDRIDSSGFPRSRLTIEVTEGDLIEDLGEAARLLAGLRSAGCRVAIDDFGTGYSSLAYLKALPLDYLKIDRKLAQDIAGSTRDRIVVRGVIDMARSLGLVVIAEGVETEEQLELLAKEGCQLYQGFLCSEPVSASALAGLVAG